MDVFSAFTGLGSYDLGIEEAGAPIIGQCEKDLYCLNVLRRHWPDVPRWMDIRHVTAKKIHERCGKLPDLIAGGFPCQQISSLNSVDRQGIGTAEKPTERSGLWWEMFRLICEVLPRWVCIENVPRLRIDGADRILESLEGKDYSCWPIVVGATHVGAPHERLRVWIIGCRLKGIELPAGLVARALADADRRHGDVQRARSRLWAEFTSGRPHVGDNDQILADAAQLPLFAGQSNRPGASSAVMGDATVSRPQGYKNGLLQSGGITAIPDGSGQELADSPSGRAELAHVKGARDDTGRLRRPRLDLAHGPFWPLGQGDWQWFWEAQRELPQQRPAECGMGVPVDGAPTGMAVIENTNPSVVDNNSAGLRALGNANPPWVAYAIGRAILRIDSELLGTPAIPISSPPNTTDCNGTPLGGMRENCNQSTENSVSHLGAAIQIRLLPPSRSSMAPDHRAL